MLITATTINIHLSLLLYTKVSISSKGLFLCPIGAYSKSIVFEITINKTLEYTFHTDSFILPSAIVTAITDIK